jgi:hypothetical protein
MYVIISDWTMRPILVEEPTTVDLNDSSNVIINLETEQEWLEGQWHDIPAGRLIEEESGNYHVAPEA